MNTSQATPARELAPQGTSPESTDTAAHRRHTIRLLIVAFVVAGIVLIALHLLRPDAPASDAQPHSPPVVTQSDAPAAMPLPEPRPAADGQAAARLDVLEERTSALAQRVDGLSASLVELATTLTALSDTTAQLRTELDARARPPRSAVRPAAPVRSPASAKPKLPAIVSVDTWGDRASVAIQDADGKLAFYREGDTVGLARIHRIDPHARQVHLRLPDGTTTAVAVHD